VFSSSLSKDYYKEYMASPERSLRQDANLFVRIFEEEFVDREDLWSILEDESSWWNDDLA
jgi:N utilization substance protein B